MSFQYTNKDQVLLDANFYIKTKRSEPLDLGLFPKIAEERWGWIVEKWPSLKTRFESLSAGDQDLSRLYEDLRKEVLGFQVGSKINPFSAGFRFFKYSFFLTNIDLSEVKLTQNEIQYVKEEQRRILNLDEDDFKSMIAVLKSEIIDITQEIGLSDEQGLSLYGIQKKNAKRSATVKDLSNIKDLNEIIKIIRGFIFDKQIQTKRPPNLLSAANENQTESSQAEILDIYSTYIPAPFEISLEHMAKKYLGSVARWYELVTVNNLKPPFIDEIGEKYTILAPPAENSLLVPSSFENKIFVGSRIKIGSNAKREKSAIIQRYTVNENNTMSLVVFAEGININEFLVSDGAYIRVYEPSTTRRGSQILVPSSLDSGEDSTLNLTPKKDFIRSLDRAFIQFGVDISKNEYTGDFDIDSNGNFQLSYGIKAVRQAVLNALKIKTGELNFHPYYGLSVKMGFQYFGTNNEALAFADIIRSCILKDSRFQSVIINKLDKTENSLAVQMIVRIKGLRDPIPLAFIG